MARPRTPSSTGRCPRSVGRGFVPDRAHTVLAASPEFDGGVRCASDDIGANLSARSRSRNAGGGAAAGLYLRAEGHRCPHFAGS